MSVDQALIDRAQSAIAEHGWSWSEEHGELPGSEHLVHLEWTKGERRMSWGLFERSYCWAEAFEAVTGRDWIELIV